MRDYGKISPSFWTGATGKILRKCPESQIVAIYLMTCPQANMLGLYYMPTLYIAHETGLGLEGANKGLQWACESGFCSYDSDTEMVWVHEMAFYQIADSLTGKDMRIKGVQNQYDALPSNPYLKRFFDKYSKPFLMINCRDSDTENTSPYQAPTKPLPSQEHEQEQENEQEQNKHVNEDVHATISKPEKFKDEIQNVFEHWKTVMNKRGTVILDSKRKSAIRARLADGYTQDMLCKAVDGCGQSDYHMARDGKNTTRYDDLTLICRDASKVDFFMAMTGQAKNESNQVNEEPFVYKPIEKPYDMEGVLTPQERSKMAKEVMRKMAGGS